MRSRSALDRVGSALGAVLEGVWCGALAAALTGSSWALLCGFAVATAAAAAVIAEWTGASAGRDRAGRVAAAVLVVTAVVVLLVAGRAWAHDYILWQVVRDALFVSLLAVLGIRLGGEEPSPEGAVRRAVRAFILVCAVLVFAAAGGSTPGWAAAAVVVTLVAGALLVAVMRYRALSDLVAEADRLPSWPWLLAVTGVVLCIVAVAALVNQLLDIDVLRWLFGALAGVLSAALDAIAYALAWAGAGLVRVLQWLLGLIHVRAPHLELEPPSGTPGKVVVPPYRKAAPGSSTRLALTVAAAAVAVAGSLAVVVFALRRLRRRTAADEAVPEEREALGSLRGAAGAAAAGLGRRLRRRFAGLGRREARSPGERIRLRYARLERRLAAAGQARPPGVTVREYLVSCAATTDAPPLAADLAGLYELARYSAHAVDAAQARRFEELAQTFGS
jgi:hypothetical protein